MALHQSLGTGNIHIPYQWSYADQAAREGASGFDSGDLYKLARQEDNNTLWMLVATTPTWVAVSGAGATAFTDLADTPSDYTGHAEKAATVNAGEDGLDFTALVSDFLGLSDTPSSYFGQGGKSVAVTSGEDGLEFVSSGLVEEAERLVVSCLKSSAGTINAGEVVYLVGYSVGSNKPTVELAQANSSATMPAFGIAKETITNVVPGDVVAVGRIGLQDTSAFSAADEVYVSETTAGGLEDSAPTGATNFVQKIAVVLRSHGSLGVLEIFGAGRSNALPNLAEDKYWVGDASGVPAATDVPVFGRDYQRQEVSARATTTGEDQVRVTLTTGALTGTYRVAWGCKIDAANKPGEANLYNSTDTTELDYGQERPVVSDARVTIGGVVTITLTGSSKVLQLRYGNPPGETETIGITYAFIEFWRVS